VAPTPDGGVCRVSFCKITYQRKSGRRRN
jgi:hypothetical protein